MDPTLTLSPQIRAVLGVLQQRMEPASFNDRFGFPGGEPPASFEDRFPVAIQPHEIAYGMSRVPYDQKVIDDLFNAQAPSMPPFPGYEEFLSPGGEE